MHLAKALGDEEWKCGLWHHVKRFACAVNARSCSDENTASSQGEVCFPYLTSGSTAGQKNRRAPAMILWLCMKCFCISELLRAPVSSVLSPLGRSSLLSQPGVLKVEKATSARGADGISLSSALGQAVPSGRMGRQSEGLRRASGPAGGALGSTAAPFGDTTVAATSQTPS